MIVLIKKVLLTFVMVSLMKEVYGYRLTPEQNVCLNRLLVIFDVNRRQADFRMAVPKTAFLNKTPNLLRYTDEEQQDPYAVVLYYHIHARITADSRTLTLEQWCNDYCNNVINDPSSYEFCVENLNEFFPNDIDPTTILKHGYLTHTKNSLGMAFNYPEYQYFVHIHDNIPYNDDIMTIAEVCQGHTEPNKRKGSIPYKKQDEPGSSSGRKSSGMSRNKTKITSSNVVPYEELFDLI